MRLTNMSSPPPFPTYSVFCARLFALAGASSARTRMVKLRRSASRFAPTRNGLVEPGSGSISCPASASPMETNVPCSSL
jgi:hypothetical protein